MKYVTDDGKTFNSEVDARNHEKELFVAKQEDEISEKFASAKVVGVVFDENVKRAQGESPKKATYVVSLVDDENAIGWVLQRICPRRFARTKKGELINLYQLKTFGGAVLAKKQVELVSLIKEHAEDFKYEKESGIYFYEDEDIEVAIYGGTLLYNYISRERWGSHEDTDFCENCSSCKGECKKHENTMEVTLDEFFNMLVDHLGLEKQSVE